MKQTKKNEKVVKKNTSTKKISKNTQTKKKTSEVNVNKNVKTKVKETTKKETPKTNNKIEHVEVKKHINIKQYKKRTKVILLLIFILIIIILLLLLQKYNMKPEIDGIVFDEKYNEDKTKQVSLNIKTYNPNNVYCKFESKDGSSDWILVEDGKCSYNVKTNDYKITLKYNGNLKAVYNEKIDIDGVIKFELTNYRKYLAVGDSFHIDTELDYVGEKYSKIEFISSDPNIASVDENGNVNAIGDGTVTITAKVGENAKKEFSLISTSLLRAPSIDNYREVLPCNTYSKEEVELLDKILDMKIKDAGGEGTRAAATEAARFITLELKYKVPYFYENGRLTFSSPIDGEGRYYHKGLYIGSDKEKEITLNFTGPAAWGCPLQDAQSGLWGRNGLDCSGYVTWVLVQAGLDLGDIGAGITGARDYTDVGEFQRITYDLMHSGKVKPGDLIGWDGHIAIIGAMTEDKIYVTESLEDGVIIDEYDYSSPYARFYGRYQHIINMSDNYYNGDGNLKNMW